MEEEAAKWTIGAEDAPEEGIPLEDEWEDVSEDESDYEGGDDEDEDDEDVLDLD